MAPIKPGQFEFSAGSLVEIRERLGLSQVKMANLLGIPANTLSRWEIGATTPDAESLAAVFSAASHRGITPNFFRRRKPVSKPSQQRSRLLAMWDFQNLGLAPAEVAKVDSWIRAELDRRFSSTSYRRFKAFAHVSQSVASGKLLDHGWRVWEDDVDMDDEIANQARSDCGQEPQATVMVLITRDGDFVDLVDDLKEQGVAVFLISPPYGSNQRLIQVVGTRQWIKLNTQLAYAR